MKTSIINALKSKYPELNLSAKLLDKISDMLVNKVSDESQVDSAINEIEPLFLIFKSEVDRRVNEAKQKNQQLIPLLTGEDVPAWAKSLMESNQRLQQEISLIKGETSQKTRVQMLTEKLINAPEVLRNKIIKDFSRMKFESDEDFEAYLNETGEDLKLNDSLIDSNAITGNVAIVKSWAKERERTKDAPRFF